MAESPDEERRNDDDVREVKSHGLGCAFLLVVTGEVVARFTGIRSNPSLPR